MMRRTMVLAGNAATRSAGVLAALVLAAAVAACGPPTSKFPEQIPGTEQTDPFGEVKDESILGGSGISLFGGDEGGSGGGGGIGVNSFLWRASLDTIAFMPLASADPFGGVIISDWYTAPDAPNERLKVTVYILDKRLRADGVRVTVFRQVKDGGSGSWVEGAINPETQTQLENAILTRARQLRIATIAD